MDRGGEDVVRRLAHVHVVVRVDVVAGEGGDHLVRVHVRRGARAGLEDVDRELVVELAVGDAVGGGGDALGLVRVEQLELRVHARSGGLDPPEPARHGCRDRLAADREVLDGLARLRAPELACSATGACHETRSLAQAMRRRRRLALERALAQSRGASDLGHVLAGWPSRRTLQRGHSPASRSSLLPARRSARTSPQRRTLDAERCHLHRHRPTPAEGRPSNEDRLVGRVLRLDLLAADLGHRIVRGDRGLAHADRDQRDLAGVAGDVARRVDARQLVWQVVGSILIWRLPSSSRPQSAIAPRWEWKPRSVISAWQSTCSLSPVLVFSIVTDSIAAVAVDLAHLAGRHDPDAALRLRARGPR